MGAEDWVDDINETQLEFKRVQKLSHSGGPTLQSSTTCWLSSLRRRFVLTDLQKLKELQESLQDSTEAFEKED